MSLNSGLFENQEQSERDLTEGPGWTIDQEHPTFWSGFGVSPALRGLGQGAADGYALLTGAIHNNLEYRNPAGYEAMTDAEREQSVDTQKMPEDWASEQSRNALAYSKSLTPDPRVTGTAANLLQGFSRVASLYTAGSLAGGPTVGAGLLAYSEGYARYRDLLDQGVDEETAHNAASLEGAASAAGALMPFSLPARWLASMSTAAEFMTQMGTGAAINTAFGGAQRYESAKILTDAGYGDMADQAHVWDKTNLLTDALTGLFFGGMGALHGRGIEADPAVRDAAKVVQDRQAILDRAPGVPVNMESQAIHKAALETALTDLLQDKPVSLDPKDVENAVFARPAENGELPRNIIREEFLKSGVLDDAEQIDRWMRGEPEPEPTPAAAREAVTPPSEEGGGEATPASAEEEEPQHGPLADRPDLKIVDEDGTVRPAAEALDRVKEQASEGAEADKVFAAAAACGARFG